MRQADMVGQAFSSNHFQRHKGQVNSDNGIGISVVAVSAKRVWIVSLPGGRPRLGWVSVCAGVDPGERCII